MKALTLTALLLAVSLAVFVPVAKGDVGATWDRQAAWGNDAATQTPGGPLNPSPDFAGNPTYGYVWATGSGLNDFNPANRWYAQIGTPMVWDPTWAGGTKKLWAQADDIAPNIRWDLMSQVTSGWTRKNAPVVQWRNPTGSLIGVKVTGRIRVEWFGDDYVVGGNPNVDIAIARITQTGVVHDLATWTINRRNAGWIGGASTGKFINIDDLDITPVYAAVNPSDMIVWSFRTRDFNQGPDTAVRMLDDIVITEVEMSEVPEPLTVGLLACGGLGMLVRRRKRHRSAGK